MDILDFYGCSLCHVVGSIFEAAAKKMYYPPDFAKAYLASDMAESIFRENPGDYSQSALWQLGHVEDSIKEKGITVSKAAEDYSDQMYWIGYILEGMMLLLSISPKKIAEDFDVEKICNAYDTLHTVSTEVAVDMIRENFQRASVVKE